MKKRGGREKEREGEMGREVERGREKMVTKLVK